MVHLRVHGLRWTNSVRPLKGSGASMDELSSDVHLSKGSRFRGYLSRGCRFSAFSKRAAPIYAGICGTSQVRCKTSPLHLPIAFPIGPASMNLASGQKGANEQGSDSLDPNPNPSPNYVFIRWVSYPWDEYRVGQSLPVCART